MQVQHQLAVKHLSQDPIMLTLIQSYQPFEWHASGDMFYDLLDSIISQQLSIKAAATIFGRFTDYIRLQNGTDKITPASVLSVPDQVLRQLGLSSAKVLYVKSLAMHLTENKLMLQALPELSDQDVITQLIQVKGIGRWTAEMFLIFTLHRPDVFSVGDLGLRNAVSRLYGIHRDDLKAIEQKSLDWKPYRSFASRYLWKSLQNS